VARRLRRLRRQIRRGAIASPAALPRLDSAPQPRRRDPRLPDGSVPIKQKYYYEIAHGNLSGQFAALPQLIAVSGSHFRPRIFHDVCRA